jgi:hypothetical protein
VVGQTSDVLEKTRAVVDNRVELFEDRQSVRSVVNKLNVHPLASPYAPVATNKSQRLQLRKQLALEVTDAAQKVVTVINSRNAVSTSRVKDTSLVNNPTMSENFGGKRIVNKGIEPEVSETLPHCCTKLANQGVEYASVSEAIVQAPTPFLHKCHGLRLPLENKQSISDSAMENSSAVRNIGHREVGLHTKLTPVANRNKVNNLKGTNGVRSEEDHVLRETSQEQASTDPSLTDTLKAALTAPLPIGPPPKKPPRTFAHNIPLPDNARQHNVSVPNAIDAVSNKDMPQNVTFFRTASEEKNVQKTVKPVHSKTESQIMLKKLESVLLNHQRGEVILRPKSPLVKRLVDDKATVTYSEVDLDTTKPVGRKGPLPSLPLKAELLNLHETCADGDGAISGGCLNLSCVSVTSSNPLHAQIHFYEKVLEKQSRFFVESPKNHLQSKSSYKPYGSLLHGRSRSEEHIYAEPFDYLNEIHVRKQGLRERKSPWTVLKGGESVGDLSKIGACIEEFHNRMSPSLSPKSVTSRRTTLHYLVSSNCGDTVSFAVLGVTSLFYITFFFLYTTPVHAVT